MNGVRILTLTGAEMLNIAKKVNGMVATWSGVVLDMICNTLK